MNTTNLEQENQTLRTALEQIANFDRDVTGGPEMRAIAEGALKEAERAKRAEE